MLVPVLFMIHLSINMTSGVWSVNVKTDVETYDFRASASMKTPMTSSVDQLWTVQGYAQTSLTTLQLLEQPARLTVLNFSMVSNKLFRKNCRYIRLPIL